MAMNPRLLRPTSGNDSPASIPGLALWLDAAAADALYTTDAGPVTAVSSPLDISGCVFWLDASNTDTVSVSGSDVTSWTDAINAVSLTPTGSVTVGASLNGLATVRLNGAGTKMIGSGTLGVTDDHTILMVLRPYATASTSLFSFGRNLASQLTGSTLYYNAGLRYITKNSGAWATDVVANSGATLTLGQPFLATARRGSSALAVGSGGMLPTAVAGTSGNLQYSGTDWNIGGFDGNALDADIAEIIVYPTALSTSDRARVEAYLANKWSIANVHAPAVTASDPVGYWRDRSGNGRHATQSTAASRPVVQPSQINSRAVIRFDGTDDRMAIPSLGAQAFTVICVGKKWSATTDAFIALGNTANFVPYAIVDVTGLGTYGAKSTGGANGAFAGTTTRRLLSTSPFLALQDSAISIRVDGAPLDLSDTGTSAASVTSFSLLGAKTGGGDIFGKQEFGELLVYDRALSTAERRKVEVYLARRWGITLAPQVSNAEAQDWISRVYANGGTVSTSTASAVSTFCDAIESAGIRDRFYRLGIFAGDNLNAALVPLYRGPTFGGTTYGNATDTNNGPFVSGDYSLASGLWPGASNSSKYLNTGYKANTLAASNTHLGLGLLATNTINNSFRTGLGAFSGSSNSLEMILHSTVSGARCASFTRFGTATDTAGDVVFNASLTAGSIVAAWPTVYRDGVATGTDATTSQDYPSAHDMFVFANSSGGVTPINYSNPRLGYYSIGATMTSAQALAYSTAMSAFYSAIGRS